MHLNDHRIGNEGTILMGRIVGMLPWNWVLRWLRRVSVVNVTAERPVAFRWENWPYEA